MASKGRQAPKSDREAHLESFMRLSRSLRNCTTPGSRVYTLSIIDDVLDLYLRDRLQLGLRDMEAWGLITPAIMYFAGELADTPNPKRVGHNR